MHARPACAPKVLPTGTVALEMQLPVWPSMRCRRSARRWGLSAARRAATALSANGSRLTWSSQRRKRRAGRWQRRSARRHRRRRARRKLQFRRTLKRSSGWPLPPETRFALLANPQHWSLFPVVPMYLRRSCRLLPHCHARLQLRSPQLLHCSCTPFQSLPAGYRC